MKIMVLVACCLAILGLMSSPGNTAPIVYSGFDTGANSTDPRTNSDLAASSFDAAVAGSNLITFESALLVGTFSSVDVAPGVNLTGIDYDGFNEVSILNSPFLTPDSLFGYNVTPSGTNFAFVNGGTITFTFATPIQAFGAYISGIQLDGETITFNDGSSQIINIPNPDPKIPLIPPVGGITFVGFTDFGASISSITINSTSLSFPSGDYLGVDDVRVVNTVPEPSTMLLLGSGLIGVLGLRRKFRK